MPITSDRPNGFIQPTTAQDQLRVEALSMALRYSEAVPAETVVETAEKFYLFLKGSGDEQQG